MNIQEASLPPELKETLPDLLAQVSDYLNLEERGFTVRDVRYRAFYTVDASFGFVIFDYTTDGKPAFAFVHFSLAGELENSACIASWPPTEGETLAWSIAEYLERNPIDND